MITKHQQIQAVKRYLLKVAGVNMTKQWVSAHLDEYVVSEDGVVPVIPTPVKSSEVSEVGEVVEFNKDYDAHLLTLLKTNLALVVEDIKKGELGKNVKDFCEGLYFRTKEPELYKALNDLILIYEIKNAYHSQEFLLKQGLISEEYYQQSLALLQSENEIIDFILGNKEETPPNLLEEEPCCTSDFEDEIDKCSIVLDNDNKLVKELAKQELVNSIEKKVKLYWELTNFINEFLFETNFKELQEQWGVKEIYFDKETRLGNIFVADNGYFVLDTGNILYCSYEFSEINYDFCTDFCRDFPYTFFEICSENNQLSLIEA